MKHFFKIFYFLVLGLFIFYLALPSPNFPLPPPDSLQSDEPADTETSLRRAYFTNMSREEVINYYREQFDKNIALSLRLNYPPEEAQTIIRDQTRSMFLEEITHPFRESVYINGFEPTEKKDEIWYGGRHFRQKIIIRYVPSSLVVRVSIATLSFLFGFLLINFWIKVLKVKYVENLS